MTNLFELLNAPTSLNPRDLATHIRMQVTLPEEVRNNCSRDLARADIRLTNELTTCRFSRKMPKTDDPDYEEFCEELSNMASVVPIPYKYFATEYNLMKTEGDPRKAAAELTDPWRAQAYAAQYLRFAVNAETDNPEITAKMWRTAILQYQRFFTLAKVEESYTWQFAEDDDARALCRDAWDNFLLNQLQELSKRQKEYIKNQNSESSTACLETLALKEASAILPHARTHAIQDSLEPMVKAIKSAETLAQAGEMYEGCPKALKEQDEESGLLSAMLAAIKAELVRCKAGKETADDVSKWLKKLKVLENYQHGGVMVRIDAKDVYEQCTEYLRFALESEDADIIRSACRICTPDLFPDDVVIVRINNKDTTRKDFAPILLGAYAGAMCEKTLTRMTETNAKNLAKKLLAVATELGRDESCYAAIVRTVNYMNEKDADSEVVMAFLQEFDGDIPLQDKNSKTVAQLRKRLGDDPGLKLFKQLAQTDCGNSGYSSLVNKVINYAKAHKNDEVGGETIGSLAKKIIMQEFVASANTYKKKPNAALMGVLKNMASFLGNNTELPAGDGTITVGAVMSSLNTAQEMSCFHDVQEAETGSDKELRAVQAVIRFAQNNGNKEIDDTTVRELAEKLLLSVYIGNANGYEGQSTRRKIMRTIAEWLPANTELRGADMTVQAFDNTVEPKHEILRIRDNLQEGTLSNRDLGALAYYATKWPDVDLGGGQMLHDIAKHFLHAAVVQAANAVQRNQYGSARDEFAAALAAAQTVPGCISGTEAKTLSRIISALSIMQTSCPSYRPEYPPFNVKKGGGRSGSGGLFKKLSGLFKKK